MSKIFNNKMLMDTLGGIREYNMIEKGDKVIVAISGGKDSLALLDLLVKIRKYFFNSEFEIFAVHVVAEVPDVNDITDPITEHFKRYEGEITPIVKRMKIPDGSKLKKGVDEGLTCQWCTYSRRMTFFKMAEDLGITKIAYGHHKDDIVDTIMMNIVNGSTMNPMPAYNMMKRGNMAIIRPMVFLREADIIKYGKIHDLVPINSCCPLDGVSFRTTVRETIDILEERHPNFVNKFFDAYNKKLSLKDDISCAEKKNKKILEDEEKIKKSDFSSEKGKKKIEANILIKNFKTGLDFLNLKRIFTLPEKFIENKTRKKHNFFNHVNWFFKKIKMNNLWQRAFKAEKWNIYMIDFGMNLGDEINGLRPALVYQENHGNDLPLVIPVSSFKEGNKYRELDYLIEGDVDNGLIKSVIKINQMRTVSKKRFELNRNKKVLVKGVIISENIRKEISHLVEKFILEK